MKYYALERYVNKIMVFSNQKARDAWVRQGVSPGKELRVAMRFKDLRPYCKTDFVHFLPWQEDIILNQDKTFNMFSKF